MRLTSPFLVVRGALVVGRVVSLSTLVVTVVSLPPPTSAVVTVMRGVMALVGPLGISMGVACHLGMGAATRSLSRPAPHVGHLLLKGGVGLPLELALVFLHTLAPLAAWVCDHPSVFKSHKFTSSTLSFRGEN